VKTFAIRMMMAVFAAAFLAASVSVFPLFYQKKENKKREIPVFKSSSKQLRAENLVDFIRDRHFQLTVKKVDLQRNFLFLELSQERVKEPLMYQEILALLKAAFTETENIDQVRLFVHRNDGADFLLTATREEFNRDPGQKRAEKQPPEKYLKSMFHVITSPE
jgi:hypothetical protein